MDPELLCKRYSIRSGLVAENPVNATAKSLPKLKDNNVPAHSRALSCSSFCMLCYEISCFNTK